LIDGLLLQDADGKVTLTEFVNACLGHEQFSKMLALKVALFFHYDCHDGGKGHERMGSKKYI
jgi:hypothetical protein